MATYESGVDYHATCMQATVPALDLGTSSLQKLMAVKSCGLSIQSVVDTSLPESISLTHIYVWMTHGRARTYIMSQLCQLIHHL